MLDLLLLTNRSQLKRDLNCHLGRYFLSSISILNVSNIYIVRAACNKNSIFVSLLAGKEAMLLSGAANFNKLASTQYKTLDSEDKEALKALSSKTTDCAQMTSKEIKRSASRKLGARLGYLCHGHVCHRLV